MNRIALLIALLLVASCDSGPDTADSELVVQATFEANRTLPPIYVSETTGVDQVDPSWVSGADVSVTVGVRRIAYESGATTGMYAPADASLVLGVGDEIRLQVSHAARDVVAETRVPPPLHITSFEARAPDKAIEAVLLDSLSLPIDSLSLSLPSRQGFIYPVTVNVEWARAADAYWIQTRLEPISAFSSTLIDFFLLTRAVIEESEADPGSTPATYRWEGVYAVPVDGVDSPLPRHELLLAVTRGDESFARFALSSNSPEQREPIGNVIGGLGLVTGLATDSIRISLP